MDENDAGKTVGTITIKAPSRKLLNYEIKVRRKTNLVQSKTLMEMLEKSITRYQNRVITAAEVIEELIGIAKKIKEIDKIPEEMGLTDYEYAFYTAIADNESARELMQKDTLRELAVTLYEQVKKNDFRSLGFNPFFI